MTRQLRSFAVVVALLTGSSISICEAATIASIETFALPGFSTGSLSPGLTLSPNNDNTSTASPNLVSYSVFFNSGGLGPADFEFNLDNSGGTTEYRFAPGGLVVNNTGFPLTGFRVELGFGTGANFVRSGAADALDFDEPDRDPAPASARFPTLLHSADLLEWSGATVGLGGVGVSFAVDVPDGLASFHPAAVNRFTVRLTPVAVPEPSTSVLILTGLPLLALRLRRRC